MISLESPAGIALTGDAWTALELSRAGLTRFLRQAQAATGLSGEVEVLLADDRALRRLNRQFRGKNQPTDVLSFPAPPEMAGATPGDLAISLETAARQAAEHGHTLRDELRILLLHGLLHLSGMDHEKDGGEMAAREAELRRMLRLKHGLIARATAPAKAGRQSHSTSHSTSAQQSRKREAGSGTSVSGLPGTGAQTAKRPAKRAAKRTHTCTSARTGEEQ